MIWEIIKIVIIKIVFIVGIFGVVLFVVLFVTIFVVVFSTINTEFTWFTVVVTNPLHTTWTGTGS